MILSSARFPDRAMRFNEYVFVLSRTSKSSASCRKRTIVCGINCCCCSLGDAQSATDRALSSRDKLCCAESESQSCMILQLRPNELSDSPFALHTQATRPCAQVDLTRKRRHRRALTHRLPIC